MPNKLISDLTLRSDFDATVSVPVEDGVQTWRCTGAQIKAFMTNNYSAKAADYTITDSDKVGVVGMTTAGTNRTVTLPAASANTDRIIWIKKVDSGSGNVTIARAGSDTIDGATSVMLYFINEYVAVISTGTVWHVIAKEFKALSRVMVRSGNGHGSTNTKVRRFSSVEINVGSGITYADSGTLGGSFTVNHDGIYAAHYSDTNTASTAYIGISVDGGGTTSVEDLGATARYGLMRQSASDYSAHVAATMFLSAGNVVRAHTNGSPNETSGRCQFGIVQLFRF